MTTETPAATDAYNRAAAFTWLRDVIDARMRAAGGSADSFDVRSLELVPAGSGIGRIVATHQPDFDEVVVLLLALVPHVLPDLLTSVIRAHMPEGGEFPEFGGVRGGNHRGILPTGETAQFVLAGDDIEHRIEVQRLFESGHWFARERILHLEEVRDGEPAMSGRIVLDSELVELLTTGHVSRPRFSMTFPAEYIETAMQWDDLVLPDATLQQIREIEHWITHNDTLLHEWNMRARVKPGYRALFHGAPGTGKTLTATLLGRATGKDVYRIDLSRVVSKYIGETEKNLAALFDKAENKNWILLFDEADALFGKRTDIRDAHDKYANQEVSYLLQRIEAYAGLVILATNKRGNVDDAFLRRFQSVIHFPVPRAEQRRELWRRSLPSRLEIDDGIDWEAVAARHELTGAGIVNVIHFCALEALADGSVRLDERRLDAAIRREFVKEGKVV